MPGWMLLNDPPLASDAAYTAAKAAPACVGLPLIPTLFLYSDFNRSLNDVGGCLHLARVVADRDVATVVAEPVAVGRLGVGRDVAPALHLVLGEKAFLRRSERERVADVEDIRGAALPFSCSTALISSCLLPSGFASLTLMPYFLEKSSMIAP